MKPLFLSIQGLQSFQEKQTIDFEKIGRDGLFGIFGPTGSGKSTIIDGMTLALYGSIVRFRDKASETKDSFDIEAINKSCDEANVNFKFKVGENVYRVERNYKLGKKSKKLSKSAVLYKEENGEEIKIAENYKDIYQEIKENILGLTLEDFTRSVVLPQGNFSQFLRLENQEKRKMLERIFALEKYGGMLSDRASSYKNILENQIRDLEIELSSIGFNEEELVLKENELKTAETELIQLKKQEKEINLQLQEMEEVEKLEIKLSDLNKQREILENRKDYIKSLEEKIVISEKFIPVIEKIHKRNEYEEKLSLLNDEISKKKELFELGKEKLEAIKRRYSDLETSENVKEQEKEKNYVSQDKFEEVSDSYKNAIKKQELFNKKNNLKIEVENLKINFEETSSQLKNLSLEKEIVEKNLSEVGDISQNEIFEIEKEILEKANILKDMEKKKQEISKQEEKIICLEDEINIKKEQLSELKDTETIYLEQREKFFIYSLKKNLHKGDTCPICNGIYENNFIENEEIHFNEDIFEKIQKDIYFLNINIANITEKISETKDKIKILEAETENILTLKNEIEILKTKKEILEKKFQENKSKKNAYENELKSLTTNINTLTLSMGKYENQINFKINLIDEIEQEIKNIPQIIFSIEELKEKINVLKEKNILYKNLEKELNEIRKLKKDIYDNKIIIWTEKIRECEKEIIQKEETYKNLKMEYLSLAKEIDRVLLENKISDLQQMNQIENYINKIGEMKEEVEKHKNNSILVLNKIVDLKEELKNRNFSKEKYQNLAECGKIVKSSLEKSNQIIGEIRKSIEIFNHNRLKVEKILQEKKNLEIKLNPAKELAELLKGRKFLDFLSAGKLQSITRIASNTLQKITNGRYRINVDEKSDFSIIDNFNSSVRKPQSLSGGETFMVSLCLALALADQIQLRGKSRLEFFFLDEGFGTLDSELLELVFSVLENLRAEGMTVGIITHVEEIKNRIARKLMVTPAKIGESGTLVREI